MDHFGETIKTSKPNIEIRTNSAKEIVKITDKPKSKRNRLNTMLNARTKNNRLRTIQDQVYLLRVGSWWPPIPPYRGVRVMVRVGKKRLVQMFLFSRYPCISDAISDSERFYQNATGINLEEDFEEIL